MNFLKKKDFQKGKEMIKKNINPPVITPLTFST